MQQHLRDRWFNLSLYSGTVVTSDQVTFPLWNLSGKLVGYQTYTPSYPKGKVADLSLGRYFPRITHGELAVWGLETTSPSDQCLFLCEGVFDACRLHWHGLPAVAVLGNDPAHLVSWLSALPQTLISVVQGDKAGLALAKFGDCVIYLPEGEDVGSLSESDFLLHFGEYLMKTS